MWFTTGQVKKGNLFNHYNFFFMTKLIWYHLHDPFCLGAACCSYLALVAALASEADAVFIPEDPAPNKWVEKLCKRLQQV